MGKGGFEKGGVGLVFRIGVVCVCVGGWGSGQGLANSLILDLEGG